MTTATIDQIRTKIDRLNPWINPVLAIGGLLALVKLSHLNRVIRDIQVAILVAVVNAPLQRWTWELSGT